jgi:hypothetical protein
MQAIPCAMFTKNSGSTELKWRTPRSAGEWQPFGRPRRKELAGRGLELLQPRRASDKHELLTFIQVARQTSAAGQ